MNEAAELLMRNLGAAAAAGRPVDIHRLLGDMTMQVVGTTAFGRARSEGPPACNCRQPGTVTSAFYGCVCMACHWRAGKGHAHALDMALLLVPPRCSFLLGEGTSSHACSVQCTGGRCSSMKRYFTKVRGWNRVDFHTQKGDKAAAAGADGDADRLRDAVNVIFGVQGVGRPHSTSCMLNPVSLRWPWAPAVGMISLRAVSFLWCCASTCCGACCARRAQLASFILGSRLCPAPARLYALQLTSSTDIMLELTGVGAAQG